MTVVGIVPDADGRVSEGDSPRRGQRRRRLHGLPQAEAWGYGAVILISAYGGEKNPDSEGVRLRRTPSE
ncbi:MAG: hypothetical protein HYU86_06765 [Chloroflexi bacterium]|nr:hypothetical protein [Chloroflexota bacterium]